MNRSSLATKSSSDVAVGFLASRTGRDFFFKKKIRYSVYDHYSSLNKQQDHFLSAKLC